MKKFFLATGIVMITALNVSNAQSYVDDSDRSAAGEKNQSAVGELTKNQFALDFPDATNIRFNKTKDFDEVSFTQKGLIITAYYDFNNQLVGTIHNASFSDLPVSAQTNIVVQYPDYTVAKVLKFDVNADNESFYDNNTYLTLYGTSFDTNSDYFVELKNGSKAIVLEAGLSGELRFFTWIK